MSYSTVIIIGSGFGGICAAVNLQRRGINDFLILERRSFMGGTWCQNTYPGAAVDVQSPLYSLSFEPYSWSQMFAPQSELKQYTEALIDKHRLREKTELNTQVDAIAWCEELNNWQIHCGDTSYHAKFIINASGPLSTPITPKIKGQESFDGDSFHTNNWDHNVDYHNKNVAIIGTGASAAQVIPAIADQVNELHIFQRTPHWVLPRHDWKFSPFVKKLLAKKPINKILRSIIYWSLETRIIGFKYSTLLLNLIAQKSALRLIKKSISDPKLRVKVTPDYTIGCKRILLSNTLLKTYTRNNVFLHDKTNAIAEISNNAVVTTNDQYIDIDLIIYATGFDATDGLISYPVSGTKQYALSEFWKEYPRAYLGISVPRFPNLFIVTGPNTGIGHTSAIFIIEAQMNYIMQAIEAALQASQQVVEVTSQAERDYTQMVHQQMEKTVWHHGGCNSWYKNKDGKVTAMFPGFSFNYYRLTKRFIRQDHYLR